MSRAERRREERFKKKNETKVKIEITHFDNPIEAIKAFEHIIEESLLQHHLISPDCGFFELVDEPDGLHCSVCGSVIVGLYGDKKE